MDVFEGLLHDLHSNIDDPTKVGTTINRIAQYFTQEESVTSIDLLIFLLFGENGIISFIKKALASEAHKHNILSSFLLMEFVLVNYEKFCVPYAEEINKLCLVIADMRHAPAKVKENALKLLKYVFAPSFVVTLDLSNIMSTVKNLRDELSPSVQAHLFSIVGIIFEKMPEISKTENESEFLNFFIKKLKGGAKSSVTMLAGCFEGINGYLVNFVPDSSQISDIYLYIKKYCSAKSYGRKETRTAERSALKIINRHYRVFANYIYEDIDFWRKTMNYWLEKSQEDRHLGFAGLIAVYKSVTCVANQVTSAEKVENIAKELLSGLESNFNVASTIGLVELISSGRVGELLANRVLHLLMKHFNEKSGSGPMYLSLNLECISKYLTKSGAIKMDHLVQLERMAVAVIAEYPRTGLNFKQYSLQALEKSFYYVERCGDQEFDDYLKEVIYQGLIRSCSHETWDFAKIQMEITGKEIVSHKSFLPLWLHIINLTSSSTDSEIFQNKSVVANKVLDEYISSFMKINKKLDLGFRIENEFASDVEMSVEATRPNDWKIFVNNVNLFLDLTEGIDYNHTIKKWLMRILMDAIDSAYKSPLISEFYKIITVCLKIADKNNFFDEFTVNEGIIQRFLWDLAVRVGRCKGDLQISCFRTLFSAPVRLIEPFVNELVSVFKIMLEVGSGHFPLLKESLSTLEKWYRHLPKEPVECLLQSILPNLDVFLQNMNERHFDSDVSRLKWKPLKVGGNIRKIQASDTDNQLLVTQKKFLLFLGNLSENVSRRLIENEEEYEKGKNLIYEMPLSDGKLRIRVEEFLPRVIKLCLSTGDRYTRVRSCEFLHSVVTLTLGNMKQMNGELNGLFRKLVPLCLVLACDSDNKISQIYESLTIQMVHYFADRGMNFSETEIFIDCLTESVSHPYNSSLRDFAAKSIREFVKWSLETNTSAGEVPHNVNAILRSMYSLSVHPDHNKRRGAAIIFNNIYSLVKDETDLLNTHWFMFYYYFIECLSMCSLYDDMSHIINAIEIIKTSLKGKDLNAAPKVPSEFRNNFFSTLVEWIFSRCSHRNAKIRKLCMGTIEDFSKSSVKDYVGAHLKEICVDRKYLTSAGDEEDYRNWLSYCSMIFDYYNWLLMHDAVGGQDLKNAGIEEILGIFLDKLAANPNVSDATVSAKSSTIINLIEFLGTSMDRNIIWCNDKLLHFIKTCLYRPSEYKFEFWDFETREKLGSVMEVLIPKLISKLNSNERKYLLNVDEYFPPVLQLGRCLQNREPLNEMKELLTGLKMIYRLGLWEAGPNEKISGNEILLLVFKSIFVERHRRCAGLLIEANDRIFLADFIKFGIDIGVSLTTMMDLWKNTEEVIEEETFKKTVKSEYFIDMFKDELCGYFVQNSETTLDEIILHFPGSALKIIFSTLNHIGRPGYSFGCKEKFIAELCQRLAELEKLSCGSKVLLLSIVRSMCQQFPNVLMEENSLRNWIFNLAVNTRAPEEAEIIFDLFPYLSSVNEGVNERLAYVLDELFKNIELFASDSDNPDSKVSAAYRGLLNGLIRTRSLSILEKTVEILKKYKKLLNEDEIENVFTNICQINGSETLNEYLRKMFSFLYGKLFDEGNASNDIYEYFLLKLLQKSRSGFAWNSLLEKFEDLLLVIKGESLIHKISALKIVKTCVVKATREELENIPEEKKETFRNCIGICSKIPAGEESELLRLYVCSCFNTLCAVVSVKSDDKRLYKSLIFREDFPFLPRIISQKKKWVLRMDFDKLPKRRKILTNLRKSITKERQMKLGKTIGSVQYIQGGTLFDSSLNEDVTRFDFSSSVIRPVGATSGAEDSELRLELEIDELNDHECMPTLVGIIRHLVDEGITPSDSETVPFWLSSVIKRMRSLNSSENEKIFILKLICNLDEYVKPYGEIIVADILETILEVFQEKPINYLVIDLIVVIMNWKLNWSSINRRMQASFTELALYIIKKSDSYRKDIIKSNLEIAKLIIETCKDDMNLKLLSAHAFQGLQMGNAHPKGSKDVLNYLNFQFCGILLANDIPAWSDNGEEEFTSGILEHFSNDKNGKLAAEVCGLSLRYLKTNSYPNVDEIIEMTREKIQYIVSSDSVNDLSLLYAVYKNFPEMSSSFVVSIRNCTWSVKGQFKVQGLEMLLSHLKRLDRAQSDLFGSTIHSFLLDMLSPEDFEVLEVSLKIVESFLDMAVDKRMNVVFERALAFKDYRVSRVRESVYNIAANLFDKWEERYSRVLDEKIRLTSKAVLLGGMNDKDADLSEKCLEFWYSRTRGSTSRQQFSRILHELYSPETENGFLNFAAKLMIRSAVDAPEYGKYVFEHPLVLNSIFQRKIISTAAYHSTVAPTFSMTLSNSLSQSSFFLEGTREDESEAENEEGRGSGLHKQKVKRFVRDSRKMQVYFSKKKAKEERDGKTGAEVDLLREYKEGDFPYIQITHFDLLKPLEALTTKDPQIGRYFLTSIYDAFGENSSDGEEEMFGGIQEFIRHVLEQSPSSDPAIIAFLFHILLHCNNRLETDSELIAKFSKSSGWFSVGGLLIEDMIIRSEGETSEKRRSGYTPEEKKWLNLAELYRSTKEFEILRGIFLDKLHVDVNVAEAIRSESVSDWFRAANFYESALKRDKSLRNDFYVNAYLNSLARLSDWTKLNSYVCDTYDSDDLWSDSSLFENVLPWLMKSATLQTDKINAIISEIRGNAKKETDMKKFFVEELTVSHFLNGNHQWAKYYLHQMCLSFLSTWSHWNKWSNNFKLAMLGQLQLMSEIDQCLRVFDGEANSEVEILVDLWSRNRPRECDDLMNWDLRLGFRNNFLSKLRDSGIDLDLMKIHKSVVVSEFELVKSGIAQKNVKICEKHLVAIEGGLEICGDHDLRLMHNFYSSSLEFLKEEICNEDSDLRFKNIVDASSRLQRQISNMMDTDFDRNNIFLYECNVKLSRVMYLLQFFREELLEYAVTQLGLSGGAAVDAIREKELEYLENAKRAVEGVDEELLSKTYVEIVKYHRRQTGYNKQLVKCLFRSMGLGSIEARQLCCCLLNETKLAKDWVTDPEIKYHCENVPVWMFLKWMNQLVANLDSEMFPFLKDLLWSLAEEYPNSVRFAFELSKENYKYHHEYGAECREFVHILSEKLLSDVHEQNFLTALSFVTPPDLVLKYHLCKILAEVNTPQPKWDRVTRLARDLCQKIYGDDMKQFRGPIFDSLADIKCNIDLLLSSEREQCLWKEKIGSLIKNLPKINMDNRLSQYSPWLYNFQAATKNVGIEIPGQYTGDQKPILKRHVTISSFKHSVLVMNSKCRPIRISILGNDAREYKFLVKFGEDLRQDQRIEEVFGHMNYVLRTNQQTCRFSIDTYKVIPMKCNLGIIEWVDNSASLLEMLTKSNPSVRKTMERVQQEHLQFLAQDKNVTKMVTAHANGFLKVSRDRAVARFTERIYSFESDLLRKAFWRLSSYPEHFAYLRKNFAASEAVIFVAHWLIGIGDRHLENTLVSSKTGRALGIDFGCAFGFATEFLTPPELLPFRLTPQIINLMKPLGVSGVIKETMIHCLKAFSREPSVLLATLEVFALEPALDWLEKTRRDKKCTEDSEWSPRKKIMMVKEKLEGTNPLKIIGDDLKAGHSNSQCLEKYLEVLRGDGTRPDKPVLTEEEQVECLLDLASDYHVLSKTYVGWNPWL